ncbi:AAEL000047-PA [Aedes aegypti]|nr:AAEL000047-PA [Aedes aegypti]
MVLNTEGRYDPRLTRNIDLGCHAFIMDQSNALFFLDSYYVSHDYAEVRHPNKTVIIVQDPSGELNTEFMDSLRKHPAIQEIPRLLLVDPRDDEIDLWTHWYKGNPEEAEQLILLDTYLTQNGTFLWGNDIFPDKTLNMERRMFRLASFKLIPHFMFKPIYDEPWIAKYQNQTVKIDGMGGLIMVEFCNKYNCTWDLHIDQPGEWGTVYKNWTGNGIVGTITERRADVGVGSLLTWHTSHQFMGFTATIRKVSVCGIAPRPRLIPPWQTVILAFKPEVWLCIAISIVCCIGAYALMAGFENQVQTKGLGWNTMNVIAVFLFQGADILYRTMPECILSIALIAFTINLGNIFVGKNASLKTFPLFEPPIDTYEDIASRDVIWTQTHEAWIQSLLFSQNPVVQKVVSNFRVHTGPELLSLANQGQVVFGVGKLNYGHYMIGSFITAQNVHLYRLMTGDLYFEYEISMTTKTWPLKDRLSDLILWIVASGMRAYQEPVVAKRYMDYEVQIKIFHSQDKEKVPPRAMVIEDLLLAYMVLGAGLSLGMVAFVVECLLHRYMKTRWTLSLK